MTKNAFNRNQLKYIALIAMLIDHIGVFFIPTTTPIGVLCRVIGRLTAPIMCFFIAEGYYYTNSKFNYAGRLFIFAFISQFAYAFSHQNPWLSLDFNVIFTLFISLLVILSYDKITNKVLKWVTIAVLIVVSFLGDWGVIAPLWALIFWVYRNDLKNKITGYAIITFAMVCLNVIFTIASGYPWYNELWQLGTFMCIPLFWYYRDENIKTSKFGKWLFYVFYPLHLVILTLIDMYLL